MRRTIASFAILLLLATVLAPAALASFVPVERLCCMRMARHCGASAMGHMRHSGPDEEAASAGFIQGGNDCRCRAPIGMLSAAVTQEAAALVFQQDPRPYFSELYLSSPNAPELRYEADRGPPSAI